MAYHIFTLEVSSRDCCDQKMAAGLDFASKNVKNLAAWVKDRCSDMSCTPSINKAFSGVPTKDIGSYLISILQKRTEARSWAVATIFSRQYFHGTREEVAKVNM